MQRTYAPYVIVTPARNEEQFIELTLKSVVSQTIKPALWAIVSDRSTDRTDEIVAGYANRFPFIRLVRNDKQHERNTAAKVSAINLGLRVVAQVEYAYFGNLDADISFGEAYFETLLAHLESDSRLGVVGGRIFQVDNRGNAFENRSSAQSVAGAIQLFRRECFEQIGGYQSIPGGMEDGIAEITARYFGWTTRSIAGLPVLHHREMGTVGRSVYRARFNSGLTEYIVGFSPIYHIVRALSRVFERPYFVGAGLVLSGFIWGYVSRRPKAVPLAIEEFIHQEQKRRLLALLPLGPKETQV